MRKTAAAWPVYLPRLVLVLAVTHPVFWAASSIVSFLVLGLQPTS